MRDALKTELVPLDRIREPQNPSRLAMDLDAIAELASSIARQGLLQPIGLKPIGDGAELEIVYGHRRYTAVRSLGWYTIPAVLLPADISELDARQAENSQRVQLTPVEEAYELLRYQEQGHTVAQIAARVSRSPHWVAERLRLLAFPDNILGAIHAHGLPLSVAAHLSTVDHDSYRENLIQEALRHGATAATAASWVQHYHAERPRLIANQTTVDEIAARRGDYRILSPCEYCGDQTDLELTRSWRLCASCSDALTVAKRTPAPERT